MKLLVVEDDFLAHVVIRNMLVEKGIEDVRFVDNFDDVFDSLQSSPADVIMLDVFLNGEEDGWKILEKLNREFDVQVILQTALRPFDLRERGIDTNQFAGILYKPYDAEQFYKILETL